jgi:hypothetical protein
MIVARPYLRLVFRVNYAPPVFLPQWSINNERRRHRHQFSSTTSSSSNNPEQKISTPKSSSSSYTIKQSSDEVLTLHDRVKIIPLGQGIVHVQLSRPEKLNSLDIPMFEAIADAACRLKNDENLKKDLRVVIISGEGRAFCTGLDAKSVVLSGPSTSLKKLLERPSAYGGENGLGNLAQDVSYLWR